MDKADSGGRSTLDLAPLPDGQVQFLRIFCSPSGCTRTFRKCDGLVSVDAAHLKGGTQFQIFTMTTYDANRELTLLAFRVVTNEEAVRWYWVLRHYLECFPSVSLLMADEPKGV